MNPFNQTTKELCDFISRSPSCFHVVENVKKMLNEAGFLPLSENSRWELEPGKSYYVDHNGSSLAAFCLPEGEPYNFQIIAAHSDSPSFKIKEFPEITKAGYYVELNVEKYGSPLFGPWFDRPLGIAGRLVVAEDGILKTVLADSGRSLAMIPSLAIHMNREANENFSAKVQTDLLPVFGERSAEGRFREIMAETIGASPEQILGSDLFLYDRSKPSFWGADEEFFSSPKLDDLQNVFASVKALIASGENDDIRSHQENAPIRVCCIFDHEEVGSRTKQGAASTFLRDILRRIGRNLSISPDDQHIMMVRSFMLSADNAHSIHPNHLEKADPVNRPVLNGGVVIKQSASQSYTTDAVSAAIIRAICKNAGIPTQEFTNHSDIPGGSTLGNISTTHMTVNTADIGCPQLAMHGPYETSGVKDTWYMTRAMTKFYQTLIYREPNNCYSLR